jgi:uncharacterized protein with HEPN domain
MENESLKWLFDINQSIGEIDEFLVENGITSFFGYTKNKLLKRGIERNLAIIGEAMNKIKQSDHELFGKILHSRSIIALRNHLIHAYDNVSDEIEHDPSVSHGEMIICHGKIPCDL